MFIGAQNASLLKNWRFGDSVQPRYIFSATQLD